MALKMAQHKEERLLPYQNVQGLTTPEPHCTIALGEEILYVLIPL